MIVNAPTTFAPVGRELVKESIKGLDEFTVGERIT